MALYTFYKQKTNPCLGLFGGKNVSQGQIFWNNFIQNNNMKTTKILGNYFFNLSFFLGSENFSLSLKNPAKNWFGCNFAK